MKSPWLAVFVVIAFAFLTLAKASSDEPDKAPTPRAAPMIGKVPGQVRDDNGLKLKLVWCPPGKFMMGRYMANAAGLTIGGNHVEVTLTKGYWLGRTEVTQRQWEQVMRTDPWKGQDNTKEGADFTATFISWNDAVDFCRKLTEQERQAERLSREWEYMLPTSAQWERACRAGTETKFSFGDGESKLVDYAWFTDNASQAGEQYAHDVAQKKSNPWGLFDMHGNVWEWCRDIDSGDPVGGRDPNLQDENHTGLDRVFRGGSWIGDASFCQSANHYSGRASHQSADLGFRVALISVK